MRKETFVMPIDINETKIWVALEETLIESISKEWKHALKEFKKAHKKNEYGYYEMRFVDYITYWQAFIANGLILTIDQRIMLPYETPYCVTSDKPPVEKNQTVQDIQKEIVQGVTNVEDSKIKK